MSVIRSKNKVLRILRSQVVINISLFEKTWKPMNENTNEMQPKKTPIEKETHKQI